MIARLLYRTAAGAARRSRLVLALAVVLALGGGVLALRLHPSAATSTFVSSSSGPYRATQSYYRSFGEEPVVVLVKGNLQQLLLGDDIERLLGLEECLAGHLSGSLLAAAGGRNGPCGQLARAHTVKVVLGPATFLNQAAEQIDTRLSSEAAHVRAQAAQSQSVVTHAALAHGYSQAEAEAFGRQAKKIVEVRFQESVVALALQYGLSTRPSIANADFVSAVVFDSSKPAGTPKQRFAYLFPSANAALISVRMRAGLDEAQRKSTIAAIRSAVAMRQWHLEHGGSYVVTGVPVIVADLAGAITSSLALLMIAVLLVMAATLGLVFTGRPRLAPLALALLAAALTFGALSLAGGTLTVAAVAVLPVLIGLAVDYAIQFQSRVAEEEEAEGMPASAIGSPPAARTHAIATAAGVGGPTLVTAAAASAAAMLALLLSPVPMVRGFGLLLIVGIALALACALCVGAALLAQTPRGRAPSRTSPLPVPVRAAWSGARELLRDNALTRLIARVALVTAVRHPTRLLGVGLALAALGWALDTQTSVQTDLTKLVPQSLASLRGLNELESATGVAGEIDLMVSGHDVASPKTIEWMSAYESRVLARYGYSAARGCGRARLCPAFSLPDLFSASGGSGKVSASQVSGLLATIPPYFSQDVITPERSAATLAFGIRVMSLQDQQHLIEGMRAQLRPPAGVHASLVGLPVLAAQSGTAVAAPWRRLATLLAGLAAVALVLLAAFRGDARRAFVPLVPIVLATGWSALILFLVRVPLNPMSVTLGALVVAISTEFSVLLSERHRQERLAGHGTLEALRRSYRRTGAAVAASGVTATAGFGVLALSDIRMLRDFGIVTLIDLSVSLVGVLVALPAVIVLAERGGAGELARGLASPLSRLRAAVAAPRRARARSGHGRA